MNKKTIIATLLHLANNKTEIEQSLQGINETLDCNYRQCVGFCFTDLNFKNSEETDFELIIDTILAYLHDELNTGHWSEVPIKVRQAFTASSYLKTLILLKTNANCDNELLAKCINCLDLGLLLGAPLESNCDCLTQCASYLSSQSIKSADLNLKSCSKRKRPSELIDAFRSVPGVEIEAMECPSLECFNRRFFVPQLPIKLTGCMTHWNALKKWCDVNYLLRIAGDRTVPVEIGSHYTDEDWSQKLMKVEDFIKDYFLETKTKLGYLAQHNLFDQIPELKADIHTPEYCLLGESEHEPDVNAWFGPGGTVSPLHYDPKNNIFGQVFGVKQLLLFSPLDGEYLYPHEGPLLSNTSQIDPLAPNLALYPNFTKGTMYKCLLEPGEMIFMPKKWWHHVTALEKSFSVSFWWE